MHCLLNLKSIPPTHSLLCHNSHLSFKSQLKCHSPRGPASIHTRPTWFHGTLFFRNLSFYCDYSCKISLTSHTGSSKRGGKMCVLFNTVLSEHTYRCLVCEWVPSRFLLDELTNGLNLYLKRIRTIARRQQKDRDTCKEQMKVKKFKENLK